MEPLAIIEGNLVRDPEIKITPNNKTVANLRIAANGSLEGSVSYINVETWGLQAKKCSKYKKGDYLFIVGELREDRWSDQEGKNHSSFKVISRQIGNFQHHIEQEEIY